MSSITLATRGSPLALWQAHQVSARLRAVHEGLEVHILEVRTEGDRVQDRPLEALSATGVFTKEVDQRIQAGEAQAAVHSLKDQLTSLPEGIVMGMVLERGPVEDALVGRTAPTLAALPAGARVATGSQRRRAQLLRVRPDLVPVPIRGNVETRLAKLDAGEADALLLAHAGLVRLGMAERITEVIGIDVLLPAVSQGIVAVTCREEDQVTRELLARADHATTHAAALAERAFLKRIGGGCNVPAAAHATLSKDSLRLEARVLSLDGRQQVTEEATGHVEEAEKIGARVADVLLDQGAGEMIREIRT